jgi:hypothetical protein
MINKIKYFLVNLDFLIAKSFFYYQCRFKDIIVDVIQSLLRNKKVDFDFDILHGNAKINDENLVFDINLAADRGGASYSKSYELDYIPKIFKSIIDKNHKKISSYLGSDFVFENPLMFRTLSFPKYLNQYDLYSNIWHQDSHDGFKLLKIFILLEPVSERDGPLCYLDRNETKKNWILLRDRWTFDRKMSDKNIISQKYCTGQKFDYYIINTSSCLHRAQNPQTKRDMAQITLYPAWRKNKKRFNYDRKK